MTCCGAFPSFTRVVGGLFFEFELRAGSDINATNFKGNGPLHFAFGYGYDDLGEYLLSKGADASLINEAGHTCYEFNKMDR